MTYTQNAKTFADSFEQTNRTSTGEVITRVKDDAPEWCREIVYTLHDGRLPEDWIYKAASVAASYIADHADYEIEDDEDADIARETVQDSIPQMADAMTEIYTHRLKQWTLESGADEYIEEAMQEYGPFDQYARLLMTAQYLCLEWMLQTINEGIAQQTEADEEATE